MKQVLRSTVSIAALIGLAAIAGANTASATIFSGDLYYTKWTGGTNVWTVPYAYDSSIGGAAGLTLVESSATVVTSAPGADGIIFSTNGNLLIGGQTAGGGSVYEYTTAGAFVGSSVSGVGASYHLTMDPSLTKIYTSPFGGNLSTIALNGSGNLSGPGSPAVPAVSGSEGGVTQIGFGGGNVYYVTGAPNGFGHLGTISLVTNVTTRFHTSVRSAHGMVYDPFTGKMTIFGDGWVGHFNSDAALTGLAQFDVETATGGAACDFDQGAVDGSGHAFIAGCNGMTFIDYSLSGDITAPNHVVFVNSGLSSNFTDIDDLAPLVGAGSQNQLPEPTTLGLMGLGLAALGWARRRRR